MKFGRAPTTLITLSMGFPAKEQMGRQVGRRRGTDSARISGEITRFSNECLPAAI
jgi:hypothetical protein